MVRAFEIAVNNNDPSAGCCQEQWTAEEVFRLMPEELRHRVGELHSAMAAAASAANVEIPTQEENEEFLQYARQQGWQVCSSCRNTIAKEEGCNHISECPPLVKGIGFS